MAGKLNMGPQPFHANKFPISKEHKREYNNFFFCFMAGWDNFQPMGYNYQYFLIRLINKLSVLIFFIKIKLIVD